MKKKATKKCRTAAKRKSSTLAYLVTKGGKVMKLQGATQQQRRRRKPASRRKTRNQSKSRAFLSFK